MRQRLWPGCVIAVSIAALSMPAAARAGVFDAYQRLAARQLSPAPLVPTSVPPSVSPVDRTIQNGTTRRARGYSLRLVHYDRNGPDAIIVVNGGEFRSMRALLRDHRRLGFRAPHRTRVRGHRGYLLTRRLGPLTRSLVWVERGVVYSIGSGTPKKVSLAQLRSTARGLDRLERDWIGASSDPESSSGGVAVTTEHTVTADVTFEADCAAPGSQGTTVRAGQAGVTLMRRRGNSFAFAIADHRRGADPWTGTVTGTISPTAITLDVRATGTIDGDFCDSGPVSLTLDQRGLQRPQPGFHEALRRATRDAGTLLAIDETHTLVCAYGGLGRDWGLEPDFLTLGKAVAAGVPLAMYGMRDEIASLITPPEEAFERTAALGAQMAEGLRTAIASVGLPWSVAQYGGHASYFFASTPPSDGAGSRAADDPRLGALIRVFMANRGVWESGWWLGPTVSVAHGPEDVDRYLEVFAAFLAEVT